MPGRRHDARSTNSDQDLPSSVEIAYQRTRMAIMKGDYPPGASLRLNELSAENGVSMIPVREALRLLEAEGFVEIIPNRGARVARLSVRELRDVYRTRAMLECDALRQAIPQITTKQIAKARRLNAKLVDQMERVGYASYEDHRAFHFTLCEPSGSQWLMRLIGIVWDHTERYRRQAAPFVNPSIAADEHEQIMLAVERGDVDRAERALGDHLDRARLIIEQALLAGDRSALERASGQESSTDTLASER